MPVAFTSYKINTAIVKGSNIIITDTDSNELTYILLNVLSDYPEYTKVSDIKSEDKRIYLGELSTFDWQSFDYTDPIDFVISNINKNYIWSNNGSYYEFIGNEFTNDLNSSTWTLLYKAPTIERNHYRVSKEEFTYLVNSSKLVQGSLYEVYGVSPYLWDDGIEQGVTIYVKAASKNTYERGLGKFYIPAPNIEKYTSYFTCDLSNISDTKNIHNINLVTANNGATGQVVLIVANVNGSGKAYIKPLTGDWQNATSMTSIYNMINITANISSVFNSSVTIGQKVVYNNAVYKSKTGSKINIESLVSNDWEIVPFNLIDYIIRYDIIDYDLKYDTITYRHDVVNNNVVENPLGNYPSVIGFMGYQKPHARIQLFDWVFNSNVHCTGFGILANSHIPGIFSDITIHNTTFYNNKTIAETIISGIHCNSPAVDLLEIKDNSIIRLKNCKMSHETKIISSIVSLSGADIHNTIIDSIITVSMPNVGTGQAYVDATTIGKVTMSNCTFKNYISYVTSSYVPTIFECNIVNGVYDFNKVNYSSVIFRNLNFNIAGRTDKILPNMSSLHTAYKTNDTIMVNDYNFSRDIRLSSAGNFIKVQYTDSGINVTQL